MNKYTERLYNGLIKENPTMVLMLGMCPTLAVSTAAINGVSMGLSTTAVLVFWEEAPREASIADALAGALAAEHSTPEDARIAVIVGPEGGIEEAEVRRLQAMARTLGTVHGPRANFYRTGTVEGRACSDSTLFQSCRQSDGLKC